MTRRLGAAILVAVALAVPASAGADAVVLEAAPRAAATPDPTPAPTPGGTAAPAAPSASTSKGDYADPLSALGAGSPGCRRPSGTQARASCTRSGSVAHAYPVSAYGFDVQVGFSVTNLGDSFLGALQSIAALIWMALVYLVKAVLLLLEWAFSLDLLGAAMTDVRETLDRLHRDVFGETWFIAALSVAALWGTWRGLVQGRTSQTITGLGATVGLMVVGLVIVSNPLGTVGHASKLANDAAVGILAASTGSPVDDPERALSDAVSGIFDQTVRDPWCALQFGSVEYCDQVAKGERTITNADVWLEYPAASRQRRGLYHLLKGEDAEGGGRPGVVDALAGPLGGAALDAVGIGDGEDPKLPDEVRGRVAKNPERASMQEAGGTVPRFALLALIAVGMTGAIVLLAYIGVRLLLASILTLLLLLFAPVVLLAPAFGESGRATFVAWGKRLAGALVAKLLYSVFLAVVLAVAATVARLDVGWFGVWLVQIALWWGVFLKRQELLGFATAGTSQKLAGQQSGSLMSTAYHGAQLAWMGSRVGRKLAAPVTAPASKLGALAGERREARGAAIAGLASEALDSQGERAVAQQQVVAAKRVGRTQQARRELRVIDRRLASYDDLHTSARAEGLPVPTPDADQAMLLKRRAELLKDVESPEAVRAEQVSRRAATSNAQSGAPVSPRDLTDYRQARARDHAAGLPLDDDRHLRAAGIDPVAYRAAAPAEQEVLRASVRGHLDQEQRLMRAAEGSEEVRFDPQLVRRRTAEERARMRADRRARQIHPRRAR